MKKQHKFCENFIPIARCEMFWVCLFRQNELPKKNGLSHLPLLSLKLHTVWLMWNALPILLMPHRHSSRLRTAVSFPRGDSRARPSLYLWSISCLLSLSLSLSPCHTCAITPLCTPLTFLVCECPGKAQIGPWVTANEQVCELCWKGSLPITTSTGSWASRDPIGVRASELSRAPWSWR